MPRLWGILHDGNRYDEKEVFYEDVLLTDRFLQKTLQKVMWLSQLDSAAEDWLSEISCEIVITHRSPLSFKSRVRFRDEYSFLNNLSSC